MASLQLLTTNATTWNLEMLPTSDFEEAPKKYKVARNLKILAQEEDQERCGEWRHVALAFSAFSPSQISFPHYRGVLVNNSAT